MPTKENGDAGRRVLVVDDERNIRLTLAQAIETLGLEVTPATDGLEALDHLRQTPFGLVLLDLKMPGLDGMTVLHRIRERWPACPVIVFTAHGNVERAAEALKLGAADFVRKPFTPDEIRTLVEAVRERRPRPTVETESSLEDAPAYRIVVPVADPAAAHDLLRLAAASAHSRKRGEVVAVHVIEAPRQTPLRTAALEEEEARRQYVLLNAARESAGDLSLRLRTRTLAAHDAGAALLEAIKEERADHVLLARPGAPNDAHALPDAVVQALVREAHCEVTLARPGPQAVRDVVALAAEGPHAPAAARRALELGQHAGVATLTLLNVQPRRPTPGGDPEEIGRRLFRSIAEKAGLPDAKYQPHVIVDDDLEGSLRRAVRGYDTVCMGASRSTPAAQSLFGALPRVIEEEVPDATLAVVRAPQSRIRTVLDAIAEQLSGRHG